MGASKKAKAIIRVHYHIIVTFHKVCECGKEHREIDLARGINVRIDPLMRKLLNRIDQIARERGGTVRVESVRAFVPTDHEIEISPTRKDPFRKVNNGPR